MTDYQARLDDEETILTPYKVRQVEPSDLDIQPPSTQGTGLTPEELREDLRETAKEAAKNSTSDEINGAVVYTDGNSIYSGAELEIPSEEDTVHALRVAIYKALSEGATEVSDVAVYSDTEEDTVHALRVAIYKALSEGATEVSDVAVYSDTRHVEICSSCRNLLEDFGTSGLTIRTIDTTGRERQYSLDEI